MSTSTCNRCLEPIGTKVKGGLCRVPHPEYFLEELGYDSGPDGCTWKFHCDACGEDFSRVDRRGWDSSISIDDATFEPTSAQWCYEGRHADADVPSTDRRRICEDVRSLTLTKGANIQGQIDQITTTMPGVRLLAIRGEDLYDDLKVKPRLELNMPELECLKLADVPFSRVNLNPDLTPKLQEVTMKNLGDGCDLTVVLPNLKSFSIIYFWPNHGDDWLNELLRVSTRLEEFDSYRLHSDPRLSFAGNNLRKIRLYRAESLESLSLYAPRLEHLSLRACWEFSGKLRILDEHPQLSKELPPGHEPTKFVVETTNATISDRAKQTLSTHPRVEWVDETEEF